MEYTQFIGDVFSLDIYHDKSLFIAGNMQGSNQGIVFSILANGLAFAHGLSDSSIKLFDIRCHRQMNEYTHNTASTVGNICLLVMTSLHFV